MHLREVLHVGSRGQLSGSLDGGYMHHHVLTLAYAPSMSLPLLRAFMKAAATLGQATWAMHRSRAMVALVHSSSPLHDASSDAALAGLRFRV